MSFNPASLITTLQSKAELSTLNSFINGSSKLQSLFSTASDYTFLAPSNDALKSWMSTRSTPPGQDEIEAILTYHLVNGSFPTVSFTNKPQFAPTYLTNSSYSNVTISPAGQRVQLLLGSGGQPEIISNNQTISTVQTKDIICLGGLFQIVNTVLSLPISLVLLTAQANLSFFIAILNRANFLSVNDVGLIEFVNRASFTPNLTFFVPNSAAALSHFTNTTTNMNADELTALFNYHIIPDFVGYSPSLLNGTVLKTLQGDSLTITRDGSDIFVNSAKITTPDYLVVNGVIHVIDSLLDRFNATIPPQVINNTMPTNTTSTSSHSGVSGPIIAVSVVIPVIVLGILAFFIAWFAKKRRAVSQRAHTEPPIEMWADQSQPHEISAQHEPKELLAFDKSQELDSGRPIKEMYAPPYQQKPPVELEDSNAGYTFFDSR